MTFSPDGKYLFFSSDRPHSESAGLDIYYLGKKEDGWSQPVYAGTEVNTIYGEVLPCLSARRNLFFRSDRPGGYGEANLYKAEWVDGKFINVTNIGPEVNTQYDETDPCVAPNESYILYDTIRPEHNNIPQIYAAFKRSNNIWSKGIPFGKEVNTPEGASAPTLSPDGKFLFFKRRLGKERGIHWISTEIIEILKTKALK